VTDVVSPAVRDMAGAVALPRQNGELVFEAPWQGRVLGLAIGTVEHFGLPWSVFQSQLIESIAADPDRPYYESWFAALEALVRRQGIASSA
jgi:hypothetical protein